MPKTRSKDTRGFEHDGSQSARVSLTDAMPLRERASSHGERHHKLSRKRKAQKRKQRASHMGTGLTPRSTLMYLSEPLEAAGGSVTPTMGASSSGVLPSFRRANSTSAATVTGAGRTDPAYVASSTLMHKRRTLLSGYASMPAGIAALRQLSSTSEYLTDDDTGLGAVDSGSSLRRRQSVDDTATVAVETDHDYAHSKLHTLGYHSDSVLTVESCRISEGTTVTTLVFTGGQDGKIGVWDMAYFALRSVLVGHSRSILRLTVLRRRHPLLLSSGRDNAICVWNCATQV